MKRRWDRLLRTATPLLTAGVLLQAGGCTVDANLVFQGLLSSIVDSLISSLVFGAFNLV
ncbi:MAG: hypothetical protein JSV78_07135 [Phycisphaerales bacterium]|nr:MAG: hypothetical protein JSV78_07135 [Phycisphaerales bacterium]